MNTTDKIMALITDFGAESLRLGSYERKDSYESSAKASWQTIALREKREVARQAVRAEIEALVRDAERLDYLQKNARCDPKMDGKHVWWPATFNQAQKLKGETLRDAIDAAMQEKQS